MPECRRCGHCCRLGGPTLMRGDADRLLDGSLSLSGLVCLRRGEWARHDGSRGTTADGLPRGDNLAPLAREMIKLAGTGTGPHPWQCPYLREVGGQAACAVHERRPLQCRTLFCEAPQAVEELLAGGDVLSRAGLFGRLAGIEPRASLWEELAEAHEEACPAAAYLQLLQELATTASVVAVRRELDERERYDVAFRRLCVERGALEPALLPLVLGRPLRELPHPAITAGPPPHGGGRQ